MDIASLVHAEDQSVNNDDQSFWVLNLNRCNSMKCEYDSLGQNNFEAESRAQFLISSLNNLSHCCTSSSDEEHDSETNDDMSDSKEPTTLTGAAELLASLSSKFNLDDIFKNALQTTSQQKPLPADEVASQLSANAFTCDWCGYKTHRSRNLVTHKRLHRGERPFMCTICQKGFRDNGELHTHLRIHTGEKPYDCNVCEKAFTQSGALKRHMLIHTGEKPWKCPNCGRGFRERGSLTKHIRTHTGERPYVCCFVECKKAFSTSGALTRHYRLHQRPARATT